MPDPNTVVTDVVPGLDREIKDVVRLTGELQFPGHERLGENIKRSFQVSLHSLDLEQGGRVEPIDWSRSLFAQADHTQEDMFRVDEIVVEIPGYPHPYGAGKPPWLGESFNHRSVFD